MKIFVRMEGINLRTVTALKFFVQLYVLHSEMRKKRSPFKVIPITSNKNTNLDSSILYVSFIDSLKTNLKLLDGKLVFGDIFAIFLDCIDRSLQVVETKKTSHRI